MSSAQDFNQLANDKATYAAAIADADPSINPVAAAAYTALFADAARYTRFTSAVAVTFTVPKDVFQIGAELPFEQAGAGAVTPTAPVGVTINSRGGATATAGAGAVALLKQVARNVWTFTGDIA